MSKTDGFIKRVKTCVDPKEGADLWDEIKQLKARYTNFINFFSNITLGFHSDGSQKEFVDLICACLTNARLYPLRCANTVAKLIKWKVRVPRFVINYPVPAYHFYTELH